MHLFNKTHDITITVDPTFTLDSADNIYDYDYVIGPDGSKIE